MDFITSNSQRMMESSMRFLWSKQTAILDNISNAETPGYKTKYVTFEESFKRSLLADIKKRGAKVESTDRFGITTVRSNESIADALKVNAQMLKILDFLGAELAGGSDSWDDEM